MRHCARPTCTKPAAAAMSYDYSARVVWFDDIERAADGAMVLCADHADRTNVPMGWAKSDRRTPVQPMFTVPVAV